MTMTRMSSSSSMAAISFAICALSPSSLPDSSSGPPFALPPTRNAAARGVEDGLHDAVIPGASADMAGEHLAHFVLARLRMLGQKLRRGDQDAGGAEAALQRMMPAEGVLKVIELAVAGAKTLDRLNMGAVDLYRVKQTGAHG